MTRLARLLERRDKLCRMLWINTFSLPTGEQAVIVVKRAKRVTPVLVGWPVPVIQFHGSYVS